MKEFVAVLKQSPLFVGVEEKEIEAMLSCLGAYVRSFSKGETVVRQGERAVQIAVVAEGALLIRTEDYWGNRSILSSVEKGEMFGESYAYADSGPFPNSVEAAENSTVIFFDLHRILTTCPSACRFHARVIENLVYALSQKNRKLMGKLKHMSCRSTRAKLISYLSEESKRSQSNDFFIPFNRQELADYLSVDRSAMSNELCKMRDEGLLRFQKNRFQLLHHSSEE